MKYPFVNNAIYILNANFRFVWNVVLILNKNPIQFETLFTLNVLGILTWCTHHIEFQFLYYISICVTSTSHVWWSSHRVLCCWHCMSLVSGVFCSSHTNTHTHTMHYGSEPNRCHNQSPRARSRSLCRRAFAATIHPKHTTPRRAHTRAPYVNIPTSARSRKYIL